MELIVIILAIWVIISQVHIQMLTSRLKNADKDSAGPRSKMNVADISPHLDKYLKSQGRDV